MDVARAADPQKVEAARARLQTYAADATAAFEAPAAAAPRTDMPVTGRPAHFVQFESMVLQNFLQSMLPEDSTTFYGEGLAGEMWRGMLAQELGTAMAERGGIGIAERVLGEHTLEDGEKKPVAGLAGHPTRLATAEQQTLATGLVEEIERKTVATVSGQVAVDNEDA
ncbi:rod-binding protein [Nitratireductor sp. GCM10026969]|uniref:rod-binding protein n=1 Tax=Nitratireductor sp. GCM10026969 TaxID=3252645 RepID=UPI0036085943